MKIVQYRIVEAYLFDTCTMKCGYCSLAETGRVLDASQLEPYRNKERVSRIAEFFNSRTTATAAWLLQFTGGEPLLMPNLDQLCESLAGHGNLVAFYTSLFVDQEQKNFQFVLSAGPSVVDYVMASYHPEAEADEAVFFRKIESLKRAGHRIFVRYVGHPARLHRLPELAQRCEQLDVAFYPTSLLTDSYPAAYSQEQRASLESHFSSLSQFIQLQGGIETRTLRCWAGNRVIAVNFQTGNITPCISVSKPSLGNVYENRLQLNAKPISCPEPDITCICDVHYQQNIVIGGFDSDRFAEMKQGFALPTRFDNELAAMPSKGMGFHRGKAGIGGVGDESRLYYTVAELKDSLKRGGTSGGSLRPIPVGEEAPPLFRLGDLTSCNSGIVRGRSPVEITTPEGQWSYAATIAIQKRRFQDHPAFVVRLEFSVDRGSVGIGCVARDMSTYVGARERVLIAGDTICEIPVNATDSAVWLVIRNTAADGKSSSLRLFTIRTFLLSTRTLQV